MIFQVTCNQLIGWPEIFKGPKGPSSLDNIIWFNDSFNEIFCSAFVSNHFPSNVQIPS